MGGFADSVDKLAQLAKLDELVKAAEDQVASLKHKFYNSGCFGKGRGADRKLSLCYIDFKDSVARNRFLDAVREHKETFEPLLKSGEKTLWTKGDQIKRSELLTQC